MGKKKSVTVGYKYLLGMHAVLCQSPVDALLELKFGDRTAWGGTAKNKRISVFRESLFGGKAREGGVAGFIDVEGGEPTQDQNDYLESRLTGLVPNFRGVVSLVFRQFYFGNNPYIKPWSAKVRNVFNTYGNFQRRLAALNLESSTENLAIYIALDNSGSMTSGGKGTTAKAALQTVIASIPRSDKNAVGFVRWSNVEDFTNFQYGFDSTAWASLSISISGTSFNGGGTNFAAAFQSAAAFFDAADAAIDVDPSAPSDINGAASGGAGTGLASGNDPLRRLIIFVTDGEPFPTSSADDAVDVLAGISNVEVLGFNIELDDTFYTDKVDSSAETTVIQADNPGEMSNAISANTTSFADLNAAHIARDMLINPNSDGLGDESLIGTSFATAAQTLFDEGFGLSFFWANPSSKEAFKQQIEAHIDARIYFDRSNGKWEIKLIRPDYSIGSLFTFDESIITSWTSPPETPKIWELPNQVTLEYTRRDNGKSTAVTLTNIAAVQATGRIINEKVSMQGITWGPLANTVCQRELQARSSPITRGAFRAAYAPAGLNLGDAIIVHEPRVGISNMVCRVIEMEEGDGKDNSVLIRFATDVFALNPVNGSFAEPDVGEPESNTALAPDVTVAFEVPYYQLVLDIGEADINDDLLDDPDLGFWVAGCNNPGANHIQAQVSKEEYPDGFFFVADVPFAPSFQLKGDLSRDPTDTTFTADETGSEDEIAVGDLLVLDEEFLRVDSISVSGGISTFTVGRGCLDTVPRDHAAGSWAVAWQDYTGTDEVQYTAGEDVNVKVAPSVSTGPFPLNELTAQNVPFDSRAFRPYGVGQLKIDASYDPGVVVGTVTATWVHRDRTQQTTLSVEDHTSATIGPETDVTYKAIRRVVPTRSNIFSLTDVFNETDWFLDFAAAGTVEYEVDVDSPSDGTTHDFSADDWDWFDWTDIFAQSDWFLNSFVDSSLRIEFGIKAVRGSPEYENWQTPFVLATPLLPAINLTAEDILDIVVSDGGGGGGGARTYSGALAYLGADLSSSSMTSYVPVWDYLDEDVEDFGFSPTTVVIIPSGVTLIRAMGQITLNGLADMGSVLVYIQVNGVAPAQSQHWTRVAYANKLHTFTSETAPIPVVAGDEIRMITLHNSILGTRVLRQDSTFLEIEVLG